METIYPDIPRICTAMAEWIMCFAYVSFLPKRYTGRKNILFCIIALLLQIFILVSTANMPLEYWILCMILAAGCMFAFIYMCCELTTGQALYCCAIAFILAEFIASLEWQLYIYLLKWDLQFPGENLILLAIIYIGMFWAVFYLEVALLTKEFLQELSVWELISTVALVMMTFAFSNINFLVADQPFNNAVRLNIFEMRTLIDFSGIAVLYAFQSRVSEYISKKEMESIQTMLKSQYDQYRSYQDSMEFIRIQRHDLKHHIALLRAETDLQKREEWLATLEYELDSNNFVDPTGNRVLDVILSAKGQLMKKQKIHFTCVADGALLDSIHVTDICTVIGNALDNAIESVLMVENSEKRMIHLSLTQKNDFIFIQIRNYCEKEPVWKGKELLTTKKDKKNHGYGIKSIRYSIEKYGGNITTAYKDNWFELCILIPMQKEDEH